MSLELDNTGQLAAFVVGAADLLDGLFIDGEHARSLVVDLALGK